MTLVGVLDVILVVCWVGHTLSLAVRTRLDVRDFGLYGPASFWDPFWGHLLFAVLLLVGAGAAQRWP